MLVISQLWHSLVESDAGEEDCVIEVNVSKYLPPIFWLSVDSLNFHEIELSQFNNFILISWSVVLCAHWEVFMSIMLRLVMPTEQYSMFFRKFLTAEILFLKSITSTVRNIFINIIVSRIRHGTTFGTDQPVSLVSHFEVCNTKWNKSAICCADSGFVVTLSCTALNTVRTSDFQYTYSFSLTLQVQWHSSLASFLQHVCSIPEFLLPLMVYNVLNL